MNVRQSALLLLALPLAAFAGSPRVLTTFPAGAQRGTEMEVVCSGSNLEDAKGMLFDDAGFEVAVVSAEKGKFKAKVKVPAEARLGEHRFRVVTASGISDLRLFFVSPFPMVAEVENPKAPDQAQPVALGTTVYGRTQGEDQDRFEVELKQGERLSAEVVGVRLQTQTLYDPFLTISKAGGPPLTEVDDCAFSRQDPVASIVAPEDGKYVVMIKESTNTGAGECQYLLHIGSFPRPLAVYPAGGHTGEELKVTLIGDASGPIEQAVKLPAQRDDHFELFAASSQPAPQPNLMRVSSFPNTLEAEPNDEIAKATPVNDPLPVALNGIIEKPKDVDYFKFSAKKGTDYDVSVFARRLRSPLDSVIEILDAKGARLNLNDDAGGPDSYLRWKAPADADYFIAVRDQLYRGGEAFVYRVEITPVQPKVGVYLPEMVQNSNQERRAFVVPKGNRYASLVRVKRADIGGELRLDPVDLPAGVTVNAPLMDKSVDTIPMVFEAAADAAPVAKHFVIDAKLTEPPKDVSVLSGVEHDLDVAENGNQRSYYQVREDKLPIEVSDEIPVKLELVQPKVPLLQAGALNLKVVAERKNDFKGPIALALLYTPPGMGTGGPVQIKENEKEGVIAISANGNAPLQKWKVCVVGSADFGKGTVWFSSQLIEVEIAPAFVGGQITRSFVDQGDTTTMTVKLELKTPFEGTAKLQLLGLPPNTTADEHEITKDDKEVKFTVKADKNAPAATHKQLFCQFNLTRDGETMTSAFANGGILRVDKGSVAKIEEPKK
ncbi:MAG: hypothetical protein QOE70_2052 [Chthoniobacter sp.]|jgi:hypothetical protein|nr:hypothetical protein [Chthoniobacter sp.]